MQADLFVRRSGTTGNDMQLRVFFSNDNIVHILSKPCFCQIETGLNRVNGLTARQCPDEVAIMLVQFYIGSVLIGIHGYCLPPVVRQPVILFQSLADCHHFHTFLSDRTMNWSVIHLDKGPCSLARVIQNDSCLQHPLFGPGREPRRVNLGRLLLG